MLQLGRPIIGLITGTSIEPEKEFHEVLSGIADIATTRVPLYQISYSSLEQMISGLPAAAEVLSFSYPDVILWNSMTGSCLRGQETVNTLEQKIGLPVLAPSLEFVKCLRELGAERVALVSPHGVELILFEKIFFDRSSISVAKVIHLLKDFSGDVREIDHLTAPHILECVEQADFRDVDAVLFDNPACPLLSIAKQLKELIPKPILSQNQVLMRAALKRMGKPTDMLFIDSYFH